MKSYFESRIHSVKKAPRIIRIAVGLLLILGGMLGFFPVLGFWMIPLGLVILAVDFRWARHALVSLKLRLRAYRRRYVPRNSNRKDKPNGIPARQAGNTRE